MPELPLMMSSLLRADLITAVRNRRSLIAPILMALILLLVTRSSTAGQHLGGHAAIVGLVTTFALMGTSILGYALIVGRDRETGVLSRLRVTPAPGWAIIASRMAAQGIAGLVLALVIVVMGGRIDGLSLSLAQYGMVLVFSVLGIAVFLSIGQALVGLIRSADTVNAAGRGVYVVLSLLALIGQQGALGGAWASIAPWTPLGAIMTLDARVLDLAAWSMRDTESLLACAGYIVVFAALGIRWFRWLPAAAGRGCRGCRGCRVGLGGLVGPRRGFRCRTVPAQQDEAGDRDTEQQDGADGRGHVHAVDEACPRVAKERRGDPRGQAVSGGYRARGGIPAGRRGRGRYD
jgi:ABC-2 type transport system permease protein